MSPPTVRPSPVTKGNGSSIEGLVTKHLDLWTSAIKRKSTAGRGSSSKIELYGVKKLRELILELAVRGLLVPQDPNDEPASELLKRIAAERAKLVKKGNIKKDKPLPPITEDEQVFELPAGWQWAKLGMLMEMFNGRAFSQTEWSPEGLPIIRIQNLNDKNAPFNYFNGDVSETNYVEPGTFLISWSGTPGTSFGAFIWIGAPGALNQHINKCMIFGDEINKQYLRLAVNSCMDHLIENAQGGVGLKHVTKGTLNNCVFAVPPLAEQHRIVAKVDELMALCDQLEQQTDASLGAHQMMVETLLNALTSAANHQQFVSSWQRIAEHFDTLFTTEESIDQLKQTILQLAVMGKLVPQDPNDEPASELLKKIAAKPSRHTLTGWASVSLGQLGEILGGATPSKTIAEYWSGKIPWVSPKDMKRNFIADSEDHVSEAAISNSSLKKIPLGSLLMVVRGMILAHSFPVAITEREVTINQDMKALAIPREIGAYLLVYMQAMKQKFVSLVDRSSHGTCKLVSEKLWSHPVWLPPQAEQIRIVAKVNELMVLCDQLRSRLNDAQTTQLHLADAITEQALV